MSVPLVVDLDGTLIYTDMLHESVFKLIRRHPFDVLRIPLWLAQGKAVLKQQLAGRISFDASLLPYNQDLLDWLKQQKQAGRSLVLCTASDRSLALAIAQHLALFDEVLASDGKLNVAGKNKADLLVQRFGQSGFDYVGNSSADLAVWACARCAIVVNASSRVLAQAKQCATLAQIFPRPKSSLALLPKVLRVHQWSKNLLLFVPLLAAHQLSNLGAWSDLFVAFIAFSLCASAVYIANDLLDLDSDRAHPRKCKRPFASGRVALSYGAVLVPLLLLISFALAWYVGKSFLIWLIFYLLFTTVYSVGLKSIILLDCIALAMFYTLRIIAGAAAADNVLSFWLLAFSVFLFLSLAFVKRYAELDLQLRAGKLKNAGRGYLASDAPLIQNMGIVSGYASVLVLALYLNSDVVLQHYRLPEAVWGGVLVMLFWISWVWMQTHRGLMHDDPVVFALKDKVSLAAGALFGLCLTIGAIGW